MKMKMFHCDGYTVIAHYDSDGVRVSTMYFDSDGDADGCESSSCAESELSEGARSYFNDQL